MTPFPRVAFLQLIASLVGCPPQYVTWKGTPEPSYMKPAAPLKWASLRIGASSRRAVGADDLRLIDDGDGTFTVNGVGRRQIVLGIECFTWDSTLVDIADEMLAQLMSRIFAPDTLDALNGMALVVEADGPILQLPTEINARYISAAHVDLTVALATQDPNNYPGGNQYVGEVKGAGDVGTGASQPFDVVGR